MEDIMQACMNIKPQKAYFIDMPRGMRKNHLVGFFSGIESLLADGLHESIDQLQRKLIEVGQSIFETYVLLPFEIKNAGVAPMVQRQMQQQ